MGSMINHNTINELKNIKRTTSYNYDNDDYYTIRRIKESNVTEEQKKFFKTHRRYFKNSKKLLPKKI